MPTYEFRCPQGHEFEKFYRSIGTAEAAAICPVCGQPAERVMSATGFAFKGSGFYLTDYGKNAHREKGTPPAKGGAPSEGAAAKGDSGSGAAANNASGASGAGDSGGDSKKAEPKAAEAKPAPTTPKKSAGE